MTLVSKMDSMNSKFYDQKVLKSIYFHKEKKVRRIVVGNFHQTDSAKLFKSHKLFEVEINVTSIEKNMYSLINNKKNILK